VEDLIQRRLEKRSWQEEDWLYPERFCLDE
jgi:hypothetical protein